MARSKNVVRQLGNPRGLFGRFILWWLNSLNRGMNDLAFTSLGLTNEDHVLEIGFGGGTLIGRILSKSNARVAGTDISALAIQSVTKQYRDAISNGRLQFTKSEGTSLPYEDGAFSRVCCVNVIYFWADVPAMIKEAYRVLDDGGKFIVCYQESAPDGLAKFPINRVESSLSAAGFVDIVTVDGADNKSRAYHCTIATK